MYSVRKISEHFFKQFKMKFISLFLYKINTLSDINEETQNNEYFEKEL